MPDGKKTDGGDLFIVDNSDKEWKVRNYLSEWADIATGYFEIGSLLTLDGQWQKQKLEKLRILMGDEVSRRNKKALLAGIDSVKKVLDQSIEKEAGRKLSVESIERYRKIAIGINEVIKIMNQTDEVIESQGGWPIK